MKFIQDDVPSFDRCDREAFTFLEGFLLALLNPIGSMVLVYMLTLGVGYIDGIHVTIYSIHGSYG